MNSFSSILRENLFYEDNRYECNVVHSFPLNFMWSSVTCKVIFFFKGQLDQYQYLGNYPPTPPLTQHYP